MLEVRGSHKRQQNATDEFYRTMKTLENDANGKNPV
jgi:hypothetical protein